MNYLNYMVHRPVLRNACIINIHKGMKIGKIDKNSGNLTKMATPCVFLLK